MFTPNHVWVRYPKQLENKISHGSLILDFDPSFHPEWNLILKGVVHSAPETNDFGIQEKLIEDWEFVVGDTIYFHFLIADEENMIKENGENFLRVPMNQIFCYVRENKITCYGGYVLAKSIFDDDVEQVEVEGKMIPAKLSASGLVVDLDISFRENLSKIVHIGLPLQGEEELGVVPGDIIVMESQNHHKYTIEGIDYFVFHQSDIIAQYEL